MIRHRKPALFSPSTVKWTPDVVRASLYTHFSFPENSNARVQASRGASLISGDAEISSAVLVYPSPFLSVPPWSSEGYSVLSNWPNFELLSPLLHLKGVLYLCTVIISVVPFQNVFPDTFQSSCFSEFLPLMH